MKTATFALILFLLATQSVFAEGGAHLVCHEITQAQNAPKRTMVLSQVGAETIVEGGEYPFHLQINDELLFRPAYDGPVTVTQADVMVSFASADGSVRGIVFKDELDQTAVHIEDEDIGFDCN